jgi:hypothetical protein
MLPNSQNSLHLTKTLMFLVSLFFHNLQHIRQQPQIRMLPVSLFFYKIHSFHQPKRMLLLPVSLCLDSHPLTIRIFNQINMFLANQCLINQLKIILRPKIFPASQYLDSQATMDQYLQTKIHQHLDKIMQVNFPVR